MYIPQGYTQQEVMEAAQQLPEPSRFADEGRNPRMRVAVRERMRCVPHPYGCCNVSTSCMRVLTFELNNVLDFRTDRLVHFWTLVGGG